MPFVLFLIGLVLGAGGLYGYLATGNKLPDLGLAGASPPSGSSHPATVWHGANALHALAVDNNNGNSGKSYTISTTTTAYSAAGSAITNCVNTIANPTPKPEAGDTVLTTTITLLTQGSQPLTYSVVPVPKASSGQPDRFILFTPPGNDNGSCELSDAGN